MVFVKGLGLILCAIALTALTQIGGVLLIVASLVARVVRPPGRRVRAGVLVFAASYAAASLWIVPPLAALGGRQPLPCGIVEHAPVRPLSFLYCALNRHYVVPRVAGMLDAMANDLAR